MPYLQSRQAGKIICCLCLLGAGCVAGQVRDLVSYDKETDSFRCLQLYSNLHAFAPQADKDFKKDLDHLQQLWGKRASILISPIQLHLFVTIAYERKEKHKYSEVSLGGAAAKEPEVRTTKVDLDAIKIIPGEFFLSKHKTLSYYQQMVIPGKTVDGLLEEINPLLAQMVAVEADKQLQLANKGKGERLTWDEVRKTAIAVPINKEAAPPKDDNKDGLGLALDAVAKLVPVHAAVKRLLDKGVLSVSVEEALPLLEDASLRLLIKAANANTLKVSRSQAVFTAVIPLSPRDIREAIATFDFIKEAVAEAIKKGKPVAPVPAIMASFRLRNLEGMGLEVSVNLPKLIPSLSVHSGTAESKPDENQTAASKTLIDGLEERGIKINKTF